jgi:selenocysteine-specific elongation factor
LREFQPKLSKRERSLLEQIVRAFEQARFQPPTPAELAQKTGESQSKILQIIELAVETGRLKHLGGALYLDSDSERTLRSRVREGLKETGEITVGEIRVLLATSRKFALPFCQYLDRVRITRRKGDLRVAAGDAKPRPGV